MIYISLFLTVHNRDVSRSTFHQRHNNVIRVWIEHGYFKHGGMAFRQPVDENPRQGVWSSSTLGFMQAAHMLERISYAWKGVFSQRLMVLHNQALVWISSALLGFLAFRMVLRYDGRLTSALLLGISCQAVYQTFPFNLRFYWETYPTTVTCIFAIAFLILVEKSMRQNKLSGWYHLLLALIVFGMFYAEHFTSFMFMATYYFIALVMDPSLVKRQRHILTIILPAVVVDIDLFRTIVLCESYLSGGVLDWY